MKTFEHYELKYTFSNEGFTDFIKDLVYGGKGKLLDRSFDSFISSMEKTYLDQKWVSRRGVVNGEVNIKTGSMLDKDWNALIKDYKEATDYNEAQLKSWTDKCKPIMELIDKINDDTVTLNDFKKVSNINANDVKIKGQWKKPTNGSVFPKKVPALKENEIVPKSKQFIEMVKQYNTVTEPKAYSLITKYAQVSHDSLLIKDKVKKLSEEDYDNASDALNVTDAFIEACENYNTSNYSKNQLGSYLEAVANLITESVK